MENLFYLCATFNLLKALSMKKKYLITICLLLVLVVNAYGNIELRYKHINTDDGLPSNNVRCVFQDSKGFLWFGTLNGLSRYDGNNFLTFRPKIGTGISLADNRIRHITEDKNNFLWISTTPELYSCFDLRNNCFVDFTGCGEMNQNYSKQYIAKNGDIWLWHVGNGCRRIKYSDGLFSSVVYRTDQGNLTDNNVNFVTEDHQNNIWIGTRRGLVGIINGQNSTLNNDKNFTSFLFYQNTAYFLTQNCELYSYDNTKKKFKRLSSLSDKEGRRISFTESLLVDNQWVIFTNNGTYDYDFFTHRFSADVRFPLISGQTVTDKQGDFLVFNHTGKVYCKIKGVPGIKTFQLISNEKINYVDFERYSMVRDSRNIIWISTYGNGLFAYDISSDKLEHFASDRNISSDFLLFIKEDRNGGIWLSNEFSGLTHLTILNEGSERFFPENKELFDRSNTIRMLARVDKDCIWVGTRKGGLYPYDLNFRPRGPKQYFPSSIYVVTKDKGGQIWMGSRGEGLKVGDTWYRHQSSDVTSLSEDNIFSIHCDHHGRMWIGTFGGGLDLAVPLSSGGYKFRHFFQAKYGLRMIRSIEEDDKGYIWLGTSEGICIFNPDSLIADGNDYHHFSYTNGKFCSNEIKYIYRDSKHRMWVGTSGQGLNLCVPQHNYKFLKYNQYNTDDGLVNDVVQSIIEDDSGQLWIGTEYGLSRFNPVTLTFENYFLSSYALGNVYSENSVCHGSNGQLFFGTNYGLTVINPKKIKHSTSASSVIFTNLYVNGILTSPDIGDSPLKASLAYSSAIMLKYFQNSIAIDFSALDYSDNGRSKYMYKLDNYDKGWSKSTDAHSASYKYLHSGTYYLHVRSCNSAGVWSKTDAVLKIVITPPFWATWWAYLCYGMLLLLGLYFAFHIIGNFNRLRNRIQIEKELTEYKLVFFTNISHEFRTPLTLIEGAMEKIQEIKSVPHEFVHPLQTMNKSVQRMLRLINQLLEFRKMQNNKLALSLEETDVISFLYEIYLSFGDVAEQKKMEFLFEPSVSSYKMYIDKSNLDKVAYNILSNAFKYTPSGGKIVFSINVDALAKSLLIRVSDNGVGIPKDKRGELFSRFMQSSFSSNSIGVGLHLTSELVRVHKGTIEYAPKIGGGSVFTVHLPTEKSVYEEKDFLVADSVLLEEENKEAHELSELSEKLEKKELSSRADCLCPDTDGTYNTDKKKRQVLVIEDDDDIRQLLKEEIGAYFDVSTASDGTSGLSQARKTDPDLIVCDVLMPGMNGFEVTQRLKSDFDTSHVPVILLTALGSSEKQLEGIKSGADAYVTKPFSIKLLLARIIGLIEQRDRLRKKYTSEPGILQPPVCSNDRDKEFVERLTIVVNQSLSHPDFTVDEFAKLMKLGRTVFYKKLRGVTGYSPNEYLRIMRMKKAAELLLSFENYNVAEVSYRVGINDPFYFSKCFKAQFGVSPSVYQRGVNNSSSKDKS